MNIALSKFGEYKDVTIYGATIAAAIIGATLANHGTDAGGWLLAARYTARYSFALFLLAYLLPPWMTRGREVIERLFILRFGAAHAVHLFALTTFRVMAGTVPPASGLAIGGLGYGLLVWLIVAIARRRASARIRSGVLHYLLLVFVLTYATKISTPDQHTVGLAGVAIGAIAVAMRAAAYVKRNLPG